MWNQLKTILLLGVLSALLIGVGGALAPDAIWVFVAIALVMNLGAYFFSDRMVLAMYRAREVTEHEAPGLYALVHELADRARIPIPRLYLIPDRQPNAFATGRNPQHGVVAVTEGLLELLETREVRGVLAHELAHIQHRDILVSTVAAILASAITTVANVLSFGALFGGHHAGYGDDEGHGSLLGGLAMVIVAPLVAILVQLAISRSRELLADESGARIAQDPEGLARALIKLDGAARVVPPERAEPATANLMIVSPFGALDTVSRWFSTHPSTEDRVARLRKPSTGGRRSPSRLTGDAGRVHASA